MAAAANAAVPERTTGSSIELPVLRAEQAELVVHALAQLQDDICARLPSDYENRTQLELLAAAYGIRERLSFGASAQLDPRLARLLAGKATLGQTIEALAGDRPATLRRGDDSVFRGQRIAVITNLPAHYRVPLFSAISSRLEAAGARFIAFFCGRSVESRPWLAGLDPLDFDHLFLRSASVPVRARPPVVPLALEPELRRYQPTLVLSAGLSPTVSGRAARYAAQAGVRCGLWSGEHAQMKTARSRLRAAQRVRLAVRTDFGVAYGSASARYLRSLSPLLPIMIGRNTSPLPEVHDESARSPLQLVAIGDLVDRRKGIDVVIDALRVLPELECRLTVVGDGAGRSALIAAAGDDPRIKFVGALPAAETRALLSSSDVFLFPTRSDVFGLALVEAMGAGLCALVSPAAGALDDLCVDRRNCLVVPEHRPGAWVKAIAGVAADPALRRTLGARASRTVRNRWTLEHAADSMVAGIRLGILSGAT